MEELECLIRPELTTQFDSIRSIRTALGLILRHAVSHRMIRLTAIPVRTASRTSRFSILLRSAQVQSAYVANSTVSPTRPTHSISSRMTRAILHILAKGKPGSEAQRPPAMRRERQQSPSRFQPLSE